MRGLADEDLRWWAASGEPGRTDEHYVAEGSWQKPVKGNWLPLVDIGTDDGMTSAPMMEVYDGKGSYLLCQMLVVEKAATAPQAGRMLGNLLEYLAGPECFRTAGRTALVAGPQSPLRTALADNNLDFTDVNGKPGDLTAQKFETAVVEVACLDDALAATLRQFAESGGHVLLHLGTPTSSPCWKRPSACACGSLTCRRSRRTFKTACCARATAA